MKPILKLKILIRCSFIFLLAFVITLVISCSDTSKVVKKVTESVPTEVKLPTDVPLKEVQVAFAGGGWRAHTGHSGWIISLIDNEATGGLKLDDLFSNVSTIGSNSGGSWFSTMLAISPEFASQINTKGAIKNWTKDGWIGKQHELFKNTAGCDNIYDYSYLFTLCILNKNDGNNSSNWSSITKDVVYKDYPLNGATLSNKRNSWAENKTLLVGASMLTSNVLLNEYGENYWDKHKKYQYYQACHSPATPKMGDEFDHRLGASCENTTSRFHEVTPLTFTGLPPSDSNKIASPILPALGKEEVFKMGYSEVILLDPTTKMSSMGQPTDNDNVTALQAATASSAALGFLSYIRKGDPLTAWSEAHFFRNLAPSFSLNGSVKIADAEKLTAQELSDQKIVRIADGGPVDNSGVAQIVKYFQLNNPSDSQFNIVAFDNVTSTYAGTNGNNVGVDIANLFGKGLCGKDENKFCLETCSVLDKIAGCIDVPELQIFDLNALNNTPVTWSDTIGSVILIYTKYEVTTKENSNFGIAANSTGTLHAFTCVSKAGTIPTSRDFTVYDNMFMSIYEGLNANQYRGLRHLQAAMMGY